MFLFGCLTFHTAPPIYLLSLLRICSGEKKAVAFSPICTWPGCLKGVTEIFCSCRLPHGLWGPVSCLSAFCPRFATWIWRDSHSTPRRINHCARNMHMPSTCREPQTSAVDRLGALMLLATKDSRRLMLLFGVRGRQKATEPFRSIILVLSPAHRLCICIV